MGDQELIDCDLIATHMNGLAQLSRSELWAAVSLYSPGGGTISPTQEPQNRVQGNACAICFLLKARTYSTLECRCACSVARPVRTGVHRHGSEQRGPQRDGRCHHTKTLLGGYFRAASDRGLKRTTSCSEPPCHGIARLDEPFVAWRESDAPLHSPRAVVASERFIFVSMRFGIGTVARIHLSSQHAHESECSAASAALPEGVDYLGARGGWLQKQDLTGPSATHVDILALSPSGLMLFAIPFESPAQCKFEPGRTTGGIACCLLARIVVATGECRCEHKAALVRALPVNPKGLAVHALVAATDDTLFFGAESVTRLELSTGRSSTLAVQPSPPQSALDRVFSALALRTPPGSSHQALYAVLSSKSLRPHQTGGVPPLLVTISLSQDGANGTGKVHVLARLPGQLFYPGLTLLSHAHALVSTYNGHAVLEVMLGSELGSESGQRWRVATGSWCANGHLSPRIYGSNWVDTTCQRSINNGCSLNHPWGLAAHPTCPRMVYVVEQENWAVRQLVLPLATSRAGDAALPDPLRDMGRRKANTEARAHTKAGAAGFLTRCPDCLLPLSRRNRRPRSAHPHSNCQRLIHVVVTRHTEDIEWTRGLDRCLVGRLTICNTGLPLNMPGEVLMRNSGREAGCILHMLRTAPPMRHGVIAFVQAQPHCTAGHRCVLRSLSRLRAADLDAHGGFAVLGDEPSNMRWMSPWFDQADAGEPCLNETFRTLTGLTEEHAASLRAAFATHSTFQIGAQFAVSWTAVLQLPPRLRVWLDQAHAHLMKGRAHLSDKPYVHGECCKARHTCMPWLLERTYQTIFHLSAMTKDLYGTDNQGSSARVKREGGADHRSHAGRLDELIAHDLSKWYAFTRAAQYLND